MGRCITAIALLIGVAAGENAQQDPPFRRAEPGGARGSEQEVGRRAGYRPVEIEDRFFKTEDWTFYHSVEDLAVDLRRAVQRTLGPDVVGPGAPLDVSDVVLYPGRVQLFYTAVTADLGVVVWHTAGAEITLHVLIYDRGAHDAGAPIGQHRSLTEDGLR